MAVSEVALLFHIIMPYVRLNARLARLSALLVNHGGRNRRVVSVRIRQSLWHPEPDSRLSMAPLSCVVWLRHCFPDSRSLRRNPRRKAVRGEWPHTPEYRDWV